MKKSALSFAVTLQQQRAMEEQWQLVLAHEPNHPWVRVIDDPRSHGRHAFEAIETE